MLFVLRTITSQRCCKQWRFYNSGDYKVWKQRNSCSVYIFQTTSLELDLFIYLFTKNEFSIQNKIFFLYQHYETDLQYLDVSIIQSNDVSAEKRTQCIFSFWLYKDIQLSSNLVSKLISLHSNVDFRISVNLHYGGIFKGM